MKDFSTLPFVFIFLCIFTCEVVHPSDLKRSDLTLDNEVRQTESLKIKGDGDKTAFINKKPFRDPSSKDFEELGDITSDSNEDLYDEADGHVVRDYKFRKADFPYDPNAMRQLVGIEGRIYQEMKQYLRNMEGRLRMLRDYIRDYEEGSLSLKDGMEDLVQQEYNAVAANPIVSYRMMRRFAVDLPEIRNSFNFDFQQEFVEAMIEINDEMIYPDKSDYNQALNSIIKIQRYTTLDPYELSEGKLGHLQTATSLHPLHIFEIGMKAKRQKRFAMAVEWLEVALGKLEKTSTSDDEILKQRIEIELRLVVETHDKRWKRNNHKNDNYFSKRIGDNYGTRKVPRVKTYDIKRNQSIATWNINETDYSTDIQRNFVSLCSGQNFQSESEKALLQCYYETKKNPYLRINPMKMELLHETPHLLQIYDFMGPQAINNLIQAATPRLERSGVVNVDDPEASFLSEVRTSSQTWLEETRHPVLQRAEKNIETLTGLRVKSDQCSETFQIANYGTSHHYDEHMDALEDERRTDEKGERIATFMIYLSDVEVGGKTAFPSFGTAASPVAGSAVLWYNLYKNGKPDFRTWHGGCPIVHGIKWVANKWILSKCNWRSEPCTLNKDE